jgi:hypothetical protein
VSANQKGAASAAPARTEQGQREETHDMTSLILGAGRPAGAAESVRG